MGYYESGSIETLKEKTDDIQTEVIDIKNFISSEKNIKKMIETYNEVSKKDIIENIYQQIEEI